MYIEHLYNFRLTWKTELLVKNVSSGDYGGYDCVAQNAEGLDTHTVTLNVTSRPDPPTNLRYFTTDTETETETIINKTPAGS